MPGHDGGVGVGLSNLLESSRRGRTAELIGCSVVAASVVAMAARGPRAFGGCNFCNFWYFAEIGFVCAIFCSKIASMRANTRRANAKFAIRERLIPTVSGALFLDDFVLYWSFYLIFCYVSFSV